MYSEDPSASVRRIVVLGGAAVVEAAGRRLAAPEFLVLCSDLVEMSLLPPPLLRLLGRDAFCGPLDLATSLMPGLEGNNHLKD